MSRAFFDIWIGDMNKHKAQSSSYSLASAWKEANGQQVSVCAQPQLLHERH